MVINKAFTGICRGCGNKIDIYEYKGLEGGRYSSHHCKEMADYWINHPRARRGFDKLKEVQ
jgi:phosphoribosyl 1,2-cyclic phosphodiesterase